VWLLLLVRLGSRIYASHTSALLYAMRTDACNCASSSSSLSALNKPFVSATNLLMRASLLLQASRNRRSYPFRRLVGWSSHYARKNSGLKTAIFNFHAALQFGSTETTHFNDVLSQCSTVVFLKGVL